MVLVLLAKLHLKPNADETFFLPFEISISNEQRERHEKKTYIEN